MSAEQVNELISPEEYLKRERSADFPSEYADGRLYAMSGASREHSLIAVNLLREISVHLRDKPCEVHGGDMRVRVTRYRYTYPDIVVACEEVQFEDNSLDTLLNPVILIEVLSPSTEAYDRGQKFASYRRLASLQEYVLVSQDKQCIEHYRRQNDQWLLTEISTETDPTGSGLYLHSIDCHIALPTIYEKVKFASPPADSAAPSNRPPAE